MEKRKRIDGLPMPKAIAAPAPALSAELLAFIKEREEILSWLSTAIPREKELRTYLAAVLIPSPTEGTNRLVTEDGYEVILNHKINRSIDEAQIDHVMSELPEDSPYRVPGVLIKFKPELVLSGYRGLPADQLKIVQQAVTEKPGMPELSIKPVAQPDPQDVAEAAAPSPTAAPEAAPSGSKAARGARKQTGAKAGTPTAAKFVDKKAGKAKDGTIGNAINKAHDKKK
jgi:hypothetical protein